MTQASPQSQKRVASLLLALVAAAAVWLPLATLSTWAGAPALRVDPRSHVTICLLALAAISAAATFGWRAANEASLMRRNRDLDRLVDERTRDLLRSEERFRILVEHLPDPVLLVAPDGAIERVNQRACETFGYAEADLTRMNLSHLDSAWTRTLSDLLASRRERMQPTAARYRRRDGAMIPVELNARWIELDGSRRILAQPRDISRRVEIEQRLAQSAKMIDLGLEAGGAAHDFNNVLTGIIGHADLARSHLDDPSPVVRHVEAIRDNVERARVVLRRILSRGAPEVARPSRVAPLVREVLDLLRPTWPDGIEESHAIDPSCPPVVADRTQLRRIVTNLCTNAVYAMPAGGRLSVSVTIESVSSARAAQLVARPGDHVVIEVRDTGHGMDPETVKKALTPFFTTRSGGGGTGLGLPVVERIVRGHEGCVPHRQHPAPPAPVRRCASTSPPRAKRAGPHRIRRSVTSGGQRNRIRGA